MSASWCMATITSYVRGLCRTREQALALVRHWSIIQIGGAMPRSYRSGASVPAISRGS